MPGGAHQAVATAAFEKRRAEMEAELAMAVEQLQSTLTHSVEDYTAQLTDWLVRLAAKRSLS